MLVELLTIGNILMLLSNIPSIRSVIKDRSAIAGYSIIGSLLTLMGIVCFDIWYLLMGIDYLFPLLLSIPTDIYWGLALVFSVKRWMKRNV